jgi:hypothetical protein
VRIKRYLAAQCVSEAMVDSKQVKTHTNTHLLSVEFLMKGMEGEWVHSVGLLSLDFLLSAFTHHWFHSLLLLYIYMCVFFFFLDLNVY